MKKFKDSLILLTIVFSALFLLNTGMMYVCFGINALNPVQRVDTAARRNLARDNVKPAAKAGTEGEETEVEGYSVDGVLESGDEYSSTGAGSETAGAESTADTGYMTSEEVQCLGELGLRDKLAALTVLSKIDSFKSDKIYELAIDGVTTAEMEEIRGLLEKKLSEADMDVLYGILDRSRKLYAEKIATQTEKSQQAVNAR